MDSIMKKKSWKDFIESLIDFFVKVGRVKRLKKKFNYSKFFRDNDFPVMPPYARF